jgi:disulfide bond formation protein DsbB
MRGMRGMIVPRLRVVLAASAVVAALALGIALASEAFEGLVPCALCLIERWPYRIAIVLGLVGLVLPRPLGRIALALIGVAIFADAAVAAVHVGVEFRWWPSPLPECMAPTFSGGSIAQRLASMPAKPSKPCEDAAYLIPFIPVSMAAMNMLFALVFAGVIGAFLWITRRSAT